MRCGLGIKVGFWILFAEVDRQSAQASFGFSSLLGTLGPTSDQVQPKNGRKSRNLESEPKRQLIQGGIDFSKAEFTDDGKLCVIKEENVEAVNKAPIMECTHDEVEKCHRTYVTTFKPTQEERCHENFQKVCQINFIPEASKEAVEKCYRPLVKVCNNQGEEKCETKFETSCTTRYVERNPEDFVGETNCEKVPVEVCGSGCITEEGPEECHQKMVDSLLDVPEETCHLDPQKACRLITRLVPGLKAVNECTTVPKETCVLKFGPVEVVNKPLRTEWCLDDSDVSSMEGEIDFGDYTDEEDDLEDYPEESSKPQSYKAPETKYEESAKSSKPSYKPSTDLFSALQRLKRFVGKLRN